MIIYIVSSDDYGDICSFSKKEDAEAYCLEREKLGDVADITELLHDEMIGWKYLPCYQFVLRKNGKTEETEIMQMCHPTKPHVVNHAGYGIRVLSAVSMEDARKSAYQEAERLCRENLKDISSS